MTRRLHTTHYSVYDEMRAPVRIARVASYFEDEDEPEPEDTEPDALWDWCQCGALKYPADAECDNCANEHGGHPDE